MSGTRSGPCACFAPLRSSFAQLPVSADELALRPSYLRPSDKFGDAASSKRHRSNAGWTKTGRFALLSVWTLALGAHVPRSPPLLRPPLTSCSVTSFDVTSSFQKRGEISLAFHATTCDASRKKLEVRRLWRPPETETELPMVPLCSSPSVFHGS